MSYRVSWEVVFAFMRETTNKFISPEIPCLAIDVLQGSIISLPLFPPPADQPSHYWPGCHLAAPPPLSTLLMSTALISAGIRNLFKPVQPV